VAPSRSDRRYAAEHAWDGDSRSPFRKDRDRILYSTEFRRLSGITQVVSPSERFPVHNRLTHSLKVAQVGRSMAEDLLHRDPSLAACLDPDVVEAACLAHDLGHPPFGHNTERELDRLLRDGDAHERVEDGFEGNAQSFRVVTKLAVRYLEASQPGLDLTRATLNALLKYPWSRELREDKFGHYASERDDFDFARAGVETSTAPSLEAALMDWADDVTYGVHDVEDFFRVGLIPLHRLVTGSDTDERERFVAWMESRTTGTRLDRAAIEDALRPFSAGVPGAFRGVRADQHALRTFTSLLIQHCVAAVSVDMTGPDAPRLVVDEEIRRRVTVLKALTSFYVIESQSVLAQRYGQRRLIRELFEMFVEAATEREDLSIFPALVRERLEPIPSADEHEIKRLVADLIASMSEAQVTDTHGKLTGQHIGSVIDPVV
jgi:dGTPase